MASRCYLAETWRRTIFILLNHLWFSVCLQSVGSGLSLEPPAASEADEEEDGMSDIIQEVKLVALLHWYPLAVVVVVVYVVLTVSSRSQG